MKRLAGLMSVLALLATPVAAQITEATVTGGEIKGTVLQNTGVFLGIPFAAPPVGENRWRSPKPVAKWNGIKEVTRFGPACMQDPRMAEMMRAPTPTCPLKAAKAPAPMAIRIRSPVCNG